MILKLLSSEQLLSLQYYHSCRSTNWPDTVHLRSLAQQMTSNHGIRMNRDGHVFFVDQPANKVSLEHRTRGADQVVEYTSTPPRRCPRWLRVRRAPWKSASAREPIVAGCLTATTSRSDYDIFHYKLMLAGNTKESELFQRSSGLIIHTD